MKSKRIARIAVYLVVMIACLVIFSGNLSALTSPSRLHSPLVFTPLYGIALGAIVVIAGGILFFLNARYGPLITFTSKGQSQQSAAQPKRRPAWRSPIIIFIAVAVIVLLYQWFASDGNRPSQSYEPPPHETETFSFPHWVELLAPIGAGGAVVVSLAHLALTRYGVIPYNERVRNAQSEEMAFQNELLPPKVLSLASELASLGFSQLAQFRMMLTNGRELNQCLLFTGKEQEAVAWIAWAQWTAVPGIVFISFFPDNALLETRYPTTLRIKHPNYKASGNTESLAAAWKQHRHDLEDFSKQHGQPVVIDSFRSYQDWVKRTHQFLGHLYTQANTGQLLALPAALLTFNLALLGIILVLMAAGKGSMGSMVLCIFPVILITLVVELIFVISTARTIQKMG